jgi:hypothetical protein
MKNKKQIKMKDQIKLKFLSDKFNVVMVFLLQETGNPRMLSDIADDAAQTAINENPNNTNIDELVEGAARWVRLQLGMQ